MRTSTCHPCRIVFLGLVLFFLSDQRVCSTEETTLTAVSSASLGSKNHPPVPAPVPSNQKEEARNASGNPDSSCHNPQQGEGGGETGQMSAETREDQSATKATGGAVEVMITAPASVAGLDDEEQPSGRGEGYVPERYVVGCGGDRVEAAKRWKETLEWRKENKVDEILETPQPRFHDCRQVFPVYLHGRSRKGMPVLWERIGKVDVAKADELKLPLSDLTPNYVFLNECVWRLILDKGEDANDDAKFITVEDVAGVRPWHLTPKILSVLRTLTGTMKAHYVERCYKSYIINAPRAFTALWRVVSAMLDARTRAKISILGTDYLGTMQEEIDMSQIPSEYGGSSDRAMDDSDDERKILALVTRLNGAAKAEETASTTS
eukprot:g6133.t1